MVENRATRFDPDFGVDLAPVPIEFRLPRDLRVAARADLHETGHARALVEILRDSLLRFRVGVLRLESLNDPDKEHDYQDYGKYRDCAQSENQP